MRALRLLCLPLLCAGCANYDFAAARLPDGSFDRQKLIADLQASGEQSLSDGIWIPLIWLDITTFAPARWDEPDGYVLSQISGVGPLFLAGRHDKTLCDPNGASIEQRDMDWFGWGLLWLDRQSRVETVAGTRFESDWRLLTVLGRDGEVDYVRPTPHAP